MESARGQKRKRYDDQAPLHTHGPRYGQHRSRDFHNGRGGRANPSKNWASSEQAKINQLQDEERHREFLAQEGQFVLKQKRKAAEIRVKENRAQPIDLLTVNLRIIDPIADLINDDIEDTDIDYIDPTRVIDSLSTTELSKLCTEIDDLLDLAGNPSSKEYWRTMRILCRNRQYGIDGRAVRSVSSDIETMLAPKSLDQLEKLEKQIRKKLGSDEPIDTDYWQQLLDHLLVYKAKASLRKLHQKVLDGKLVGFKSQNQTLALEAINQLSPHVRAESIEGEARDPDPLLMLEAQDKAVAVVDEAKYLADIAKQRRKVLHMGYVPAPPGTTSKETYGNGLIRPSDVDGKIATSMFDQEAAKGVEEDEEVFAGEEDIATNGVGSGKAQHKLRKPRYFNRVQMGYEWNKYNQTHYDHDNPPPKVVQGYKFHIFYPDLADATKAPTYKIVREGGRKKGETVAPAGEEDTCIIHFMSGPPYEDVAFRIVDRDWDYSAKYDRGFKSTFEKGILTLHFSFKKVYYRK